MKKFAISLLAISMVVLLVFALNGGFDDAAGGYNNISGFNEAAFALPVAQSGATDSTSFLVGEFDGADGSHLSLDGYGNLKYTQPDGIVRSGTYTLLQQNDLSAMIRFIFNDGQEIHSFTITGGDGRFVLGDKNGDTLEYISVLR